MSKGVFDRELKSLESRIENVNRGLGNANSMYAKIKQDIRHERLSERTPTGVYLSRVGNYILESRDIKTCRKIKSSFYLDEQNYRAHSKIARHTVLTDYCDFDVYDDYVRDDQRDLNAYLRRLVDSIYDSPDVLHNFITSGVYYYSEQGYNFDCSPEIKELIEFLTECINAVINKQDKKILKKITGNTYLKEIAKESGVSHQSISKRIKKIVKNSWKEVHKQGAKTL